MTSVSANLKFVLIIFAFGLTAAGCQSTAPTDDSTGVETQGASTGNGAAGETYSVVSGDSLWGIAAQSRIYGNPYQWPLIYKANASSISDADLIEPGQVLNITRGASSGEVSAAVEHAKTRGAWSLGVTEDSDKAYLGR